MNKYLLKLAQMSPETKKELLDTGVLAGVGTAGSLATDAIISRIYPTAKAAAPAAEKLGVKGFLKSRKFAVGAIGGGVGVGLDYAAIKLGKAIGNPFEEKHKNETL